MIVEKFHNEKLKKLRENNGMTISDLAEKLNVKKESILKWESGTTKPRTSRIPDIAKALNCKVEDFCDLVPLKTACPYCYQKYSGIPDEYEGKEIQCQICGKVFTVELFEAEEMEEQIEYWKEEERDRNEAEQERIQEMNDFFNELPETLSELKEAGILKRKTLSAEIKEEIRLMEFPPSSLILWAVQYHPEILQDQFLSFSYNVRKNTTEELNFLKKKAALYLEKEIPKIRDSKESGYNITERQIQFLQDILGTDYPFPSDFNTFKRSSMEDIFLQFEKFHTEKIEIEANYESNLEFYNKENSYVSPISESHKEMLSDSKIISGTSFNKTDIIASCIFLLFIVALIAILYYYF